MFRRWHAGVLAVLAVFVLACEGSGTGRPSSGGSGGDSGGTGTRPPSSIVALGDSVTSAFGTCLAMVACKHNSWSTGTSTAVDSHYRRILGQNPKVRDHRNNLAVSGALASDLRRQADAAVREGAGYVTILIGANDACRATTQAMTDPRRFRQQVDAALDRLARGLPKARVLIASIPDLYRLWEVGHTDDRAVRVWGLGICQSLLANPRSTAAADNARRRAVDRRIDAYNRELSAACRGYGRRCRYDGGAVHRVRFTLSLVNRRDYFHPSIEGQRRLAAVTYPSRWW